MKKLYTISMCALFAAILLFSACKEWPWNDEPGGGGKNPTECMLTGTLVRVICGVSDLDNLWIKTDNGMYYQPCDASYVHSMNFHYTEGTRIRFGYESMNSSMTCGKDVIICGAVPPPAKRIKITCMQPVF